MKALLKAFGEYLSERRAVLLWLFICAAVFGLLSFLYGLPLSAVGYGAALCAGAGLVFWGMSFARCYQRQRALHQLREIALHDMTLLPTPKGRIEREYYQLLKNTVEAFSAYQAETHDIFRRQLDAYSLWTHQMKVPISAMRLVIEGKADQHNATLLAELFKIEQYTDMALNYARLHATATDYVIREYDLDAILRQLLRKFAPLFIQKKLSLKYEPISFRVLTDEKWLLFALEQLLSNAIKYTSAGSVTLSWDAQTETLCIRDTGVGIAAEDLPRVFEQGYTGYNGRGDKRATGLGLYLCRQALSRLEHAIRLESKPGEGTAAMVCLKRERTVHE